MPYLSRSIETDDALASLKRLERHCSVSLNKAMETLAGIGPTWTVLQTVASPLGHKVI